jgi:hypothetical protein
MLRIYRHKKYLDTAEAPMSSSLATSERVIECGETMCCLAEPYTALRIHSAMGYDNGDESTQDWGYVWPAEQHAAGVN